MPYFLPVTVSLFHPDQELMRDLLPLLYVCDGLKLALELNLDSLSVLSGGPCNFEAYGQVNKELLGASKLKKMLRFCHLRCPNLAWGNQYYINFPPGGMVFRLGRGIIPPMDKYALGDDLASTPSFHCSKCAKKYASLKCRLFYYIFDVSGKHYFFSIFGEVKLK